VPGGEGTILGRWRHDGDCCAVALLVTVFVVSRVVLVAMGFQFDLEWQGLSIQNIDLRLLQHHLLQSLWYMHGQPPLWNALVGLSMKLGTAVYPRVWHVVFLGLGLIEALALYGLLRAVRITRWVAVAVTTVFVVSPEVVAYENNFFYDYPTLVLLTVGALAVTRYAADPTLGRGFLAFGLMAALVLLRTLFQWPWLVLVAVVLLAAGRRPRIVLASSGCAMVLVGGVIAKNWVMYGVPSTTSWTGIMLARSTVLALPYSERRRLVSEGKLHSVSLVVPLSALSDYEKVGIRPHPRTGIPLLDYPGDALFPKNLENRTFVRISQLYLQDDIWILEHRKAAYLRYVGKGLGDYFASLPDVAGNIHRIRTYDTWFDRIVYGRIGPGRDGVFLIALYVFAVAAGVWITGRELRWGADAATVLIAFCTLTLLYVTFVGSVAEVGENYRFRFVLESLALVVAAAGVQRLALPVSRFSLRTTRS
jgi:hypothetical protein